MTAARRRRRTGMRFAAWAMAAVALAPGATAFAQKASKTEKAPVSFPDAPGKEVLLGKCFQCHGPNMWIAQRQDRRAWESTLYRMVGRGALWTPEEIRTMADYLGTAYGRKQG
jgi:mono/diheme cytochrome c family protein